MADVLGVADNGRLGKTFLAGETDDDGIDAEGDVRGCDVVGLIPSPPPQQRARPCSLSKIFAFPSGTDLDLHTGGSRRRRPGIECSGGDARCRSDQVKQAVASAGCKRHQAGSVSLVRRAARPKNCSASQYAQIIALASLRAEVMTGGIFSAPSSGTWSFYSHITTPILAGRLKRGNFVISKPTSIKRHPRSLRRDPARHEPRDLPGSCWNWPTTGTRSSTARRTWSCAKTNNANGNTVSIRLLLIFGPPERPQHCNAADPSSPPEAGVSWR